ncbi:unnamed protein product [Eruca vesicaria subsp. sativa]|uniref:Uncharacterized protein n=1 Tax=Eruca vesicaria subsp. sativa TaxID=29727 RepID=A0ABC8L2F0_ERUVS|nr:unnamed protein product [Eruca vesicaria subsp. sativa]
MVRAHLYLEFKFQVIVGGELAGGETCSALAKSSLPPPRPKSPPEYPDLYGKRREAARVQMLEREIGFLEAS